MFRLKKTNILLRLELNSHTICEAASSDIKGVITIGRSSECDWVIPPTDRSASNIHAKIFFKKGNVFVKDEKSRNGIYFKGTKIDEHKMAVGDIVSVGDCLLIAESYEPKQALSKKYDALEQLNGVSANKMYDIAKEKIVIGSRPDCDIVLANSLVSQRHAEITSDNDGCWIKDMGSRNGTSVNGVRVSSDAGDKGRLLRDNDVISIAYIDFRFLDKNVEHIRSHFWLKAGIIAATIFVCLGGYYLWQYATPSSKSYIDKARAMAASKNFDAAKSLLETAANAKNADIHRVERQELEVRVKQWRDTIEKWNNVKNLVANEKFASGNKILSPLLGGNMEIWTWNNSDAVSARKEAIATKNLIDQFMRARIELENIDVDIATLSAIETKLSKLLKESKGAPNFMKSLLEHSLDICAEINRTVSDLKEINGTVSNISKIEDIETAINKLNAIYSKSKKRFDVRKKSKLPYSVKISVIYDKLIVPLNQLLDSQKALDLNIASVAKFNFDKVSKSLPLPDPDQCSSDPVLTEKRAEILAVNEQLLKDRNIIKAVVDSLESEGIAASKPNSVLEFLNSESVRNSVKSCDSLDLKFPAWGRDAPTGKYDEMLGIEAFYEFITNLPDRFDSIYLSEMAFTPKIHKAKKIYSYLSTLMEILEMPTIEMILNWDTDNNKLAELAAHAASILRQRDELVSDLRKAAMSETGRACIIDGGMALILAPNVPDDDPVLRRMIAERKAIRARVLALTSGNATPEEIVERRKEVMKIALLGNPQLKQIWNK